jgi:hypothetical protein
MRVPLSACNASFAPQFTHWRRLRWGAYMAVKSVKGPRALDADASFVRLNLEYEQRPCATIGGFW